MVPHLHLRHAVAPTKDSFSVGSQQRGQRQSKYQPDESLFRLRINRGMRDIDLCKFTRLLAPCD